MVHVTFFYEYVCMYRLPFYIMNGFPRHLNITWEPGSEMPSEFTCADPFPEKDR